MKPGRSRLTLTACLALLGCALLASPAHARSSGYGEHNEAAFGGPLYGTSETLTLRLSGYGVGDDVDTAGYMRWDIQPWRLLGERPELASGVQLNNFGMHGGFMLLELGPLGLGVGFGFDFLTVGLEELDSKHPAGSYMMVPFGLEVAAALEVFSFSRLLVTYQLQVAGCDSFDETLKRQGFTAEWYVAFGSSNIYMLLALEYGSFQGDGHEFGAGQALAGLTWNDFQ